MTNQPIRRVRTRLLGCALPKIDPIPAKALPWEAKIVHQSMSALKPASRRIRRRTKGQVEDLAGNIKRLGLIHPIIVTARGEIVDGHVVIEAWRSLGHDTIPTIVVDHLDEHEVKALRLSLNKFSERSVWDSEALALEFAELFAAAPDLVTFTGFSMPEVDVILSDFKGRFGTSDPDDVAEEPKGQAVSQLGDLWLFEGGHKLLCGNARERTSYETLLADEKIAMVLSDPPFGCKIKGHASRKHADFVEGSDLTEDETLVFFESFLKAMVPSLKDGAIVDLFIDWRGIVPLASAARSVGLTQINHCAWDKGVGAMGSLYRQQIEHVLVFKWGKQPHTNNIQLGKHGRNRTTLWSAPGLNQFGKDRKRMLDMHPTVKPISLLTDALLDTSKLGDLILDPFAGSGSTLAAAHRTRRVGRAIELDPTYVDVAVRRLYELGMQARHADTGLSDVLP